MSAAIPALPVRQATDAPIGEWLAELLGTTSEHAVVFLDPEGRVVAWLGAAERLFGYTPDEAIGMPFDRVFAPEDRSLGLHRQELVVAAASGRSEDDRWHVRKDGSRFWASGLLEVVRSPDGTVAAFCKVLRDRTDVRTQLDALHNRIVALSEQHTRRTHFLIALGHQSCSPATKAATRPRGSASAWRWGRRVGAPARRRRRGAQPGPRQGQRLHPATAAAPAGEGRAGGVSRRRRTAPAPAFSRRAG